MTKLHTGPRFALCRALNVSLDTSQHITQLYGLHSELFCRIVLKNCMLLPITIFSFIFLTWFWDDVVFFGYKPSFYLKRLPTRYRSVLDFNWRFPLGTVKNGRGDNFTDLYVYSILFSHFFRSTEALKAFQQHKVQHFLTWKKSGMGHFYPTLELTSTGEKMMALSWKK